jgi:hypothetical protein
MSLNLAKIDLLRLVVTLCLVGSPIYSWAQEKFSFVALGDLPYGTSQVTYPPYTKLIDRINEIDSVFSIHVGDFKSGSTLCSNEEFANQLNHFQRFKSALIYTPGDNEWTDCHRSNNGSYEPLERLSTLRRVFFKSRQSLGQRPLLVENQSETGSKKFAQYVENVRWQHSEVLFTTLHIVGSNNNFETRSPSAVNEFFDREQANVAWIKDSFSIAAAKKINVMVFAFQADVFESKSIYEDFPSTSGFRKTIGETLLPLAQQWGKPVLIIHGDSHRFKVDQPFILNKKALTNVTRLIVPGADDVRAVEVTVAGSDLKFSLIAP